LVGASGDQALWVALPFTALVAVAIGAVRRGSGLGSDVATGVFFALAFALGVLFLGLRPAKDTLNVEALLFGSILAISPDVLVAIGALALVLGVLGSAVGLFLSYHLNAASGATIIVTLAAAFFAAVLLRRR